MMLVVLLLLMVILSMLGYVLSVVWEIRQSHADVHERLKHPFHLQGPVK